MTPQETSDCNKTGSVAAEIAALRREIRSKQHIIELMCEEWADDHTHLQKLCREVGCEKDEIEGDYSVPGIRDLADLLRVRINTPNDRAEP